MSPSLVALIAHRRCDECQRLYGVIYVPAVYCSACSPIRALIAPSVLEEVPAMRQHAGSPFDNYTRRSFSLDPGDLVRLEAQAHGEHFIVFDEAGAHCDLCPTVWPSREAWAVDPNASRCAGAAALEPVPGAMPLSLGGL